MPQLIDVSGIPPEAVKAVESLVALFRTQEATPHSTLEGKPTAESWEARLQAWVDSHPKREIIIDDSRDSIYAGRGE